MINFYDYYNRCDLDYFDKYVSPLRRIQGNDWNTFWTHARELKVIEHIIKRSPVYSYIYASFVIEGRFIEGEQSLKTSSMYAYRYAHLIQGRFIEAESTIMQDSYWWGRYRDQFL